MLSTGEGHTVREFCEKAFNRVGIGRVRKDDIGERIDGEERREVSMRLELIRQILNM